MIRVDDVNDNFPVFTTHATAGWVLESEPPGTPVMQVNAIDRDSAKDFKDVS